MTENSSSAVVGCESIDSYLDSVEQAMIAANAPRGDRLQVLQDLESQIADMLSQQPPPLTEEIVQSVIEKLEPPSHFAETYANGKEAGSPIIARSGPMAYSRWAAVSAISCAAIPVSCLFLTLAATGDVHGPVLTLMAMPMLIGFVLTPIALWNAFKQLRAEPAQHLGRELALRSMSGYCVAVPTLLFLLACAATGGYILFPLGVAAFVYLQYLLVRRLWRRVADTLPPQPTSGPANAVHERHPTSRASFSNLKSMAAI